MKRFLIVVTAALFAFALTGVAAASADDVTAQAPPGPMSPIVWTGNGTNGGLCSQIFDDPSVAPGDQVWLFILTSPSGGSWALTASFDDGTTVSGQGPSKTVGSIHFEVTTDVGAKLLSASATNGSTNSVLTVSHCTVRGGEPPETPVGSLSVVKVVEGGAGQTLPAHFTAHVTCGDGESVDVDEDVTLPNTGGAGTPALIDNIPAGDTCTVVEDTSGNPAGTVVTYTPTGADSPGVTIVENSNVEVSILNSIPDVAGVVVVDPTPPVQVEAATAVAVAPSFTG